MTATEKFKNITWLRLLILSVVTFGIYIFYWAVLLKRMLVEQGETDLPTSWLLIIPLANLYLMWLVFQVVETRSKGKLNALLMMILSLVFLPAAVVIVHDWALKQ